jgi:hypothetical protein
VAFIVAMLSTVAWQQSTDQSRTGPPLKSQVRPAAKPDNARADIAEFYRLLRSRGSLTFRSWNGVAYRMDADTELVFLRGGKAHMLEYGVGLLSYHGTYHIDRDGIVTTKFPEFKPKWPAMQLRQDSRSLTLEPKKDGNGFVMGNRGGATIVAGQRSYWPFRPVPAKEEKELRAKIK